MDTPHRRSGLLCVLILGLSVPVRGQGVIDSIRQQARPTSIFRVIQAREQGVIDSIRQQARSAAPRVRLSGQTDLRFADGGPDPTPFAFNIQGDTGGVSTFVALDLHLFLNAELSRRTKLFIKFLGSSDDSSRMTIEAMTLITRLGKGWPILEAGRFTNNFGRFSQRFLPMDNPLIGEPLLYTYPTPLPTNQIPGSPDDLLGQRGRGDRVSLPGYAERTVGQNLVSSSWFLNGVRLAGAHRKLRYSLSVSNEPTSGSSAFDINDDKAITVHLGYKPDLALGIGLSAARGAYLDHGVLEVPSFAGVRLNQFLEDSVGMDLDYARGHFLFFGEYVYKHWDSPTIAEGLGAQGFFLEPRYKLAPGLYVALRVDHIGFDEIATASGPAPWSFDVDRLEVGLGYSPERDLRMKASYQINRTGGASPADPDDNLFQAQVVGAF